MAEQESDELLESLDISLLETLDHVLSRGLVIAGEITISVADIDLLFMGLNLVLTSTETAREVLKGRATDREQLPAGEADASDAERPDA